MAPSESEINALLSGDSFSVDVIPKFEEYVTAQVSGQIAYHSDSVRRLIKLYQLYPTTSNPEKVAQGCLLALLKYPEHTDFLALKYIIPTNIMNQEPCALIKTCFDQLESCQFSQFWESYEQIKSSSLGGYLSDTTAKTIQGAILQVLSLTYKEAPSSVILPALKLSSMDAVKALNHGSVESVSNDKVIFVPTGDNTKRQRLYQESLNFESISALMSKIAQ